LQQIILWDLLLEDLFILEEFQIFRHYNRAPKMLESKFTVHLWHQPVVQPLPQQQPQLPLPNRQRPQPLPQQQPQLPPQNRQQLPPQNRQRLPLLVFQIILAQTTKRLFKSVQKLHCVKMPSLVLFQTKPALATIVIIVPMDFVIQYIITRWLGFLATANKSLTKLVVHQPQEQQEQPDSHQLPPEWSKPLEQQVPLERPEPLELREQLERPAPREPPEQQEPREQQELPEPLEQQVLLVLREQLEPQEQLELQVVRELRVPQEPLVVLKISVAQKTLRSRPTIQTVAMDWRVPTKTPLVIVKIAILVPKIRVLSRLPRIKELGFANVIIVISTFLVVKCQPLFRQQQPLFQIAEMNVVTKKPNVASTEFAEDVLKQHAVPKIHPIVCLEYAMNLDCAPIRQILDCVATKPIV
jgi:hypothetical protein